MRTPHARRYGWFAHLARLGVMALLLARGSTLFAFGAALVVIAVSVLQDREQSRA